MNCVGGKALDGLGGLELTEPNQTLNAGEHYPGVRLREISSVAERERAQIVS